MPSNITTFSSNNNSNINDKSIQDPTTYHGISKLYMEKLGNYYYKNYGTNFRSLRFPLIITPGETDNDNEIISFVNDVFMTGVKQIPYQMYIEQNVKLPVMYISDCIRGVVEFTEAGNSALSRRIYNYNGFILTPEVYIKQMSKTMKNKQITYDIKNYINDIVKTFPLTYNDSLAQKDWGWKPKITNEKLLCKTYVNDLVEIETRRNLYKNI
jgi:threonine 3-dehydrogenase